MLNVIKNIIKEKKAFQESANIILENEALDDSIILGQEAKEEEPAAEPEKIDSVENDTGAGSVTGDDAEKPAEEVPAEEVPAAAPEETPAVSDDSAILSTEINLATNTSDDTIPVAPNAANEVVVDDILNSEIDAEPATPVPVAEPAEEPAGVEDDILNTEIEDDITPAAEEEPKEEEDILQTEIDEESAHQNMSVTSDMDGKVTFDKTKQAIADDSKATQKESDKEVNEIAAKVKALPATERAALMKELGIPYTEAISIDDSAAEGGEETKDEGEKNDVTSAIEDKVGEINAEEPSVDDGSESSGGVANGNEALMKKLSNLTKTIEDIKMNLVGGSN